MPDFGIWTILSGTAGMIIGCSSDFAIVAGCVLAVTQVLSNSRFCRPQFPAFEAWIAHIVGGMIVMCFNGTTYLQLRTAMKLSLGSMAVAPFNGNAIIVRENMKAGQNHIIYKDYKTLNLSHCFQEQTQDRSLYCIYLTHLTFHCFCIAHARSLQNPFRFHKRVRFCKQLY